MRELEIYIHIPFCVKKCAYCDFLSAPASGKVQNCYIEALKKEIAAFEDSKNYIVTTVFIGGGTPSILSGQKIAEILSAVRCRFAIAPDPEITIECNPGTASFEKLVLYRKAGINRISFGLQSADNEELKKLGRIHTWEQFQESYIQARRAGFENINIDLMSGLPGQTLDSWENTIQKVLALKPEHISAYGLILEEGTPFYQEYGEDARRREDGEIPRYLPSEETERQMYHRTGTLLKAAGIHQYEISNYAVNGKESRHNTGYWIGTEYVGFGLGASSLLDHKRIQNTTNLEHYLDEPKGDRCIEILSESDEMAEYMFLGLRRMKGVSRIVFQKRFGKTMEEVYGEILKKYLGMELLEEQEEGIRLTRRGIDVSNVIMAEFIL